MSQCERLLQEREAIEAQLREQSNWGDYLLASFIADDDQERPLSETEWSAQRAVLVEKLRRIDSDLRRLGCQQL